MLWAFRLAWECAGRHPGSPYSTSPARRRPSRRSAVLWLVPIICGAVLLPARDRPLAPEARDPFVLTGQVTSPEEGPMEGVLVSAKRSASTITITVVSDREGRYRFPESRLSPGE